MNVIINLAGDCWDSDGAQAQVQEESKGHCQGSHPDQTTVATEESTTRYKNHQQRRYKQPRRRIMVKYCNSTDMNKECTFMTFWAQLWIHIDVYALYQVVAGWF